MLALFIQLHRQAIAQKCVARIVDEHRFDFFATRHGGNLEKRCASREIVLKVRHSRNDAAILAF